MPAFDLRLSLLSLLSTLLHFLGTSGLPRSRLDTGRTFQESRKRRQECFCSDVDNFISQKSLEFANLAPLATAGPTLVPMLACCPDALHTFAALLLCCSAALLPCCPAALPRKIGRIKLAYQIGRRHSWYRKNTNASSLSSLTCI